MRAIVGALICITMSVASWTGARAAETVSVGMISDPSYHAVMWAAMNNKVSDPNVTLKVELTPIPALIQAVMSKQYDLLAAAVLAVPTMVEQGLDARILGTVIRYKSDGVDPGIWVKADSPVKTIADLKGKSLAIQSISAADVTLRRVILSELYGYNTAAIGGDFKWVELPAAQHEAAVELGRVDAAAFSLVKAYQVTQSPSYRLVWRGGPDLMKLYDAAWPAVLLISYQDKLSRRPEAIAAAARLLRKSAEYFAANRSEVIAAVAPQYNMPPGDLEGWFRENADMPFDFTDADKRAITKGWASAVRLGTIRVAPKSIDALTAPQAVIAQ